MQRPIELLYCWRLRAHDGILLFEATSQFTFTFRRRFSNGLNMNLALSRTFERDATSYLNEFNDEPYWNASNGSRPVRFTGTGVYELPFGKGKPLLSHGFASRLFGSFELALIYEYQVGALVSFSNFFLQPGATLADINTGSQSLGHCSTQRLLKQVDPTFRPAIRQGFIRTSGRADRAALRRTSGTAICPGAFASRKRQRCNCASM